MCKLTTSVCGVGQPFVLVNLRHKGGYTLKKDMPIFETMHDFIPLKQDFLRLLVQFPQSEMPQ